MDRALLAAAIAAAPIALYGLLQQTGLQLLSVYGGYLDARRSTGTFGSPTVMGSYLAMVAPIVVTQIVGAKNRRLDNLRGPVDAV